MWALWIIIGIVIGSISSEFFRFLKSDKKDSKNPYLRRGIMNREYQVNSFGVKTDEFTVQVEVGEMERTDKKSKIKCINIVFNGTRHDDGSTRDNIKKLIDNCWIDSNDIEWITSSLSDTRQEKLEKLLK